MDENSMAFGVAHDAWLDENNPYENEEDIPYDLHSDTIWLRREIELLLKKEKDDDEKRYHG